MPKIRAAMNRGAFDFLTKPIDFTDLETTILKAMEQMRLVKESSSARKQVEAFRHELGLASSIQQSMLPARVPRSAWGRTVRADAPRAERRG